MAARFICAIICAGTTVVTSAQEIGDKPPVSYEFRSKPGAQVIISAKLYENDTQSKQTKILSEPSVVAMVGRPFSVASGGEVIGSKPGDDDLRAGPHTSGRVSDTGGGAFRLAIKLELGSVVPVKGDADTNIVRTDSVDIRTALRPKETKKFKISDTRWCEVRVDPVDQQAPTPGNPDDEIEEPFKGGPVQLKPFRGPPGSRSTF